MFLLIINLYVFSSVNPVVLIHWVSSDIILLWLRLFMLYKGNIENSFFMLTLFYMGPIRIHSCFGSEPKLSLEIRTILLKAKYFKLRKINTTQAYFHECSVDR